MYKNVLQSIDNIAIWPVISFVIFFLFFLCLLWWVFTADKKLIAKMEMLPMEEESKQENDSLTHNP
jgi:cytochrome c oxidase cbb3-type subunit IV